MTEPPSSSSSWQEQRRAAAEGLADAAARKRAAEAEQAAALLREFAAQARSRGLRTAQLAARGHDGRSTYRTGVEGWYLRRNHTLGVGLDGAFYVLTVPGGLRARFRGVELAASDPPLVVGAGGRDGESIALPELIALRLAAGDDW
ncbi:hypothetical protein [Motilibacter rhizosphaerae]|uniref:hypothetical protein n=1 Tax=Motilibacter rhizosphaerae TaxID=598652 RepID=UPI0018C89172|nr:hypothetical protein [Motilibacter rhizosphaerae]